MARITIPNRKTRTMQDLKNTPPVRPHDSPEAAQPPIKSTEPKGTNSAFWVGLLVGVGACVVLGMVLVVATLFLGYSRTVVSPPVPVTQPFEVTAEPAVDLAPRAQGAIEAPLNLNEANR